MESNKDEALRCFRIAEQAIASENKERALKFIKIARRLNRDLSVDELLAACEKLGSGDSGLKRRIDDGDDKKIKRPLKFDEDLNGERNCGQEDVELIRQIKRNQDYYEILGVERTSTVEQIRKAYRKLSLKVHPDKNKAPGSEEAFKKVSKAFKCLSDDDSRRQYDHVGLVDEFEYNQRHNVRQRRRRTQHDFFDEDFDPDEIFRSFFGQTNMFRSAYVYSNRESRSHQREEFHGPGPNLLVLLQIIPFLLILLLAFLPFSEPSYSLHKNFHYQIPRTTEKYGVEFYVKSLAFDEHFPHGSPARAHVENNVVKDYKTLLWRYCNVELQKRHWNKNLPTPHCNKLENFGLA